MCLLLHDYFKYICRKLICTFIFYRNFRDFGVITADSTMWWKAGLSIAAVTALGILVAKVLQTTEKVR